MFVGRGVDFLASMGSWRRGDVGSGVGLAIGVVLGGVEWMVVGKYAFRQGVFLETCW